MHFFAADSMFAKCNESQWLVVTKRINNQLFCFASLFQIYLKITENVFQRVAEPEKIIKLRRKFTSKLQFQIRSEYCQNTRLALFRDEIYLEKLVMQNSVNNNYTVFAALVGFICGKVRVKMAKNGQHHYKLNQELKT